MAGRRESFLNRLSNQFSTNRRDDNIDALKKYFGHESSTPFDGAFFEHYKSRDARPNHIEAADLVAVTLLSMEIRRESRSGISTSNVLRIEDWEAPISKMLQKIPSNRELHTLSDLEFERYLGAGSPADQLFHFLIHDVKMHRVATFKLLARKRPDLLPIRDSVTAKVLGASTNWWKSWHHALSAEPSIVEELRSIRAQSSKVDSRISVLSLLRVADIAIWNS